MEEDIQNYSPTVMFRGTPCISAAFNIIFVIFAIGGFKKNREAPYMHSFHRWRLLDTCNQTKYKKTEFLQSKHNCAA